MDTAAVLELTRNRPRRQLVADEMLLETGVQQSSLYVLESGELAIELGNERINTVTTPGSVIGEISMLLGLPVSADVRADGPVTVRVVEDAEELFHAEPEFGHFISVTLARRLYRITGYLDDLRRQYADSGTTLGLVTTVLEDLLRDDAPEFDPGSERESEAPY
jgi:CRP-like cAMP-binding protein